MDEKPDAKAIADEAVGEGREGNQDPLRDRPAIPTQEAIHQRANSAGPQAGRAEQTAEAVGERAAGAYADGTTKHARRPSNRQVASQAGHVDRQPLMAVAAGFALGYVAALLVHRD